MPSLKGAVGEEQLELVRKIARFVWRDRCARLGVHDLEGYGLDGLMRAAGRFDAARGASLSTYAGHRVKGAMLDALRELSRAPRAAPLDEDVVHSPDEPRDP